MSDDTHNSPSDSTDPPNSKPRRAGALISAAERGAKIAGAGAGRLLHGAAGKAGAALEAATNAGSAGVRLLREHPHLLKWLRPLGAAALVDALDKVDIEAAKTAVAEMRARHLGETPGQIAARLTQKKALYAGSIGLATSAVPGVSLLLAPLDWTLCATLQAELAYQIAAAYDLDLRDPARQGEIAAIFGVAFGGAKAAGVLGRKLAARKIAQEVGAKAASKQMPFVGAAIGAGTNALMIFTLGHAARHYYEAQSQKFGDNSPGDLQAKSDAYLEHAARQDEVFHRVLAHIARAGNPGLAWAQIEGGLRLSGLGDAALQVMADEFGQPHSPAELLAQLDCDFSVALLAQCRRVAGLDGVVNADEQQIISAIERHCATFAQS